MKCVATWDSWRGVHTMWDIVTGGLARQKVSKTKMAHVRGVGREK